MGLLKKFIGKFKKTTSVNEQHKEVKNEPVSETVAQNYVPNSLLQSEYINDDAKTAFHQGYDTTRLLINPTALNIAGQYVYNCYVSWYGQNDCADMTEPATGKLCSRRQIDYSHVLAQIDLNLIQTDINYYNTVMKDLMNKKIVDEHLEAGLTDFPDMPCGIYIGGIAIDTNKKYFKFFDPTIGQISHNSAEMQDMRAKKRQSDDMAKQAAIARKKAEIAKLQDDLNSYENEAR